MRRIILFGFSSAVSKLCSKKVLLLLLLSVLPIYLVGCAAYSLEKGTDIVPISQHDEKLLLSDGKEGTDNSLEKELAEKLAQEEKERQAREERKKQEELRKKELGAFYVPLPPLEQDRVSPVKARGIYLTGNTVGHSRYRDLLDVVESTELNAVVIDVKNDHGLVTYNTNIEIVKQVGASRDIPIKDLKTVLDELHSKNIYSIARVVVFKDPYLAEQKPEWSIQKKGGGLWRDRNKVAWVNPYDRNVWDYNIAVAREVACLGFQEIQFDYIRFPENAHIVDKEAYFPGKDVSKEMIVGEFLAYAREQLKEYNTYLSADVFGVIATSWGDTDRIGQTWEEMSPHADYICPMVYPSHYGRGYFGFSVPDAHPGKTVEYALSDALKRNATLSCPAIIRPWLQSFTASWIGGGINYGPSEIRQQIETAQRLGVDEFLLWNANNRYQRESLLPAEDPDPALEQYFKAVSAGLDSLGRTPEQAVEIFLEAVRTRDWQEAFALQITDFTMDHHDYPEWKKSWTARPVHYDIKPLNPPAGGNVGPFYVSLSVHLTIGGDEHKLPNENWEVRKENLLWRVKPSAEFVELMTLSPDPENS